MIPSVRSFAKFFGIILLIPTLFFCFSLISVHDQTGTDDRDIMVRGVYGSPRDLWEQGLYLDDLGINAVFIRYSSLDQDMVKRSRSEGQRVFVEFPVLIGGSYIKDHPEAWAIDRFGKKVEPAGWFMGVCPTDPKFRAYRISQLESLLEQYDVDGVFLDYFHWHAQFEDPNPILPETCFCEKCINAFEAYSGHHFQGKDTEEVAGLILGHHDPQWRDWRCFVLSGWARDLKQVIHQHDTSSIMGLYHCPWDDHEFNQARRRILGLDYDLLRKHVDVFSPMVYHAKMGRTPQWIGENIEWFSTRMNTGRQPSVAIWPIIQAHDDPYEIPEEEFKSLFFYGTAGDADGIMVFTSASIAQDEWKTRLLKSIYLEWKGH
jgi:hypothetical protein